MLAPIVQNIDCKQHRWDPPTNTTYLIPITKGILSTMADSQKILVELEALQKSKPLKIIELYDTIRPNESTTDGKRNSDASDLSTNETSTPASLQAELGHYKELFSKLRFSYVEQVTKEKFLRAISDNPPLFVEHQENMELEAQLAQEKAALKAQKAEVADLISELETKGRELATRYDSVRLKNAQLSSLPSEIDSLEASIENLRAAQAPSSDNPSLNLPLPETQALLAKREHELSALESQIQMLEASMPRKTKELERLEREFEPLQTQKKGVVAAAKEARRRRDEGEAGMGDDLEDRGRWLRAVEKGLSDMLESKA